MRLHHWRDPFRADCKGALLEEPPILLIALRICLFHSEHAHFVVWPRGTLSGLTPKLMFGCPSVVLPV
jgi:hypothetical protein